MSIPLIFLSICKSVHSSNKAEGRSRRRWVKVSWGFFSTNFIPTSKFSSKPKQLRVPKFLISHFENYLKNEQKSFFFHFCCKISIFCFPFVIIIEIFYFFFVLFRCRQFCITTGTTMPLRGISKGKRFIEPLRCIL